MLGARGKVRGWDYVLRFDVACATPRAVTRPWLLGTLARNQARSAPGERLPVPSGWRFGWVGAEGRAGSCVVGIKCTARLLLAPSHGQARALCCWVPMPGIKHAVRRASDCPFRRAGALVTLALTGGRGVMWLALSASLKCCSAIPRAGTRPLLLGRAGDGRSFGLILWQQT